MVAFTATTVGKLHSRFRMYDAMTATIPAMIFAVTGLGSSTVSFNVKNTVESMTKVVAPTIANLISS